MGFGRRAAGGPVPRRRRQAPRRERAGSGGRPLIVLIGILAAVAGVPVASFALYQVILAFAAGFYRGAGEADRSAPLPRTVVVVPAHDEQALIATCVRALLSQSYPRDRYEVVVIADNCTDDTAAIARAAGATVLRRDEPAARGKGHALRWATDRVLGGTAPPDAVAVVDADSVAQPDFLAKLVRPFQQGAPVVQGESLMSEESPAAEPFRAAAFLLVNRVRPAGRAVLGAPCHLAGDGMLLSRGVLVDHPWDAYTSAEDLEYSLELRMLGIAPMFAGGAVVRSPAAPRARAAEKQQLRWEGGKLHLARTWIPRLLATAARERRLGLLDAAFELAVPPLGTLAAISTAGTVVATVLAAAGVMPLWGVAPWAVAVVAIPVYVLVGLRAARAPASAYRALTKAPLYLVTKLMRAWRVFAFRGETWVRTERAEDDGRVSGGDRPGAPKR